MFAVVASSNQLFALAKRTSFDISVHIQRSVRCSPLRRPRQHVDDRSRAELDRAAAETPRRTVGTIQVGVMGQFALFLPAT
jgi:hypothetical protein